MNKYFRKFSLACVLFLGMSISLVGCGRGTNDVTPHNVDEYDAEGALPPNKGITENDMPMEERMDEYAQDDSRALERSDEIENQLVELNGVNSATVIVTGSTAIVGINMAEDVEGDITTELKNEIEAKVKEVDEGIDTVSVTADADLIGRMENLGSQVREGRPLSGLGNEIEEILRRITPNM